MYLSVCSGCKLITKEPLQHGCHAGKLAESEDRVDMALQDDVQLLPEPFLLVIREGATNYLFQSLDGCL